jgi:hypothetical protein
MARAGEFWGLGKFSKAALAMEVQLLGFSVWAGVS